MLPSGPAAMPSAQQLHAAGSGNSVALPPVVIWPIEFLDHSSNQSAPSGPVAITPGSAPGVGTAYSVIAPESVTRAIRLASPSDTHMFPSGPDVMRNSIAVEDGILYSTTG